MIWPWERVTVIQNDTDGHVELIVTLSPTNQLHKKIPVAPASSTKVAARGFCYSPNNPDRHPMTSVSADGSPSGRFLTGSHFIVNGKIIIARGPDGGLLMQGVRSSWTDLRRIKCFGSCLGGRYWGNKEPEIIQ